jgi:hypothetical protein
LPCHLARSRVDEIQSIYQFCTRHNLFNENGSFLDEKQLLKTLFRIMLLQFVYSKEFNVENLYKALDLDDFKKYYARSEREDSTSFPLIRYSSFLVFSVNSFN